MQNWNIDEITELLRQAAAAGLAALNDPRIRLKDDLTAVTDGDLAIEELLTGRFNRPDEESFMIGEESIGSYPEEYVKRALAAPFCWVVDPIDGTAPFAARLPIWGTSIGWMREGVLTEGAISLPGMGEGFLSSGGLLYRITNINGLRPELAPFTARKAQLSGVGPIAVGQRPAKTFRYSFPNQIFAWSSCVGCCQALLQGRLLAFQMAVKLWDIAGSLPLLRAAGYTVRFRDGSELSEEILKAGQFNLSPGDERWRLRDYAVAAPDAETADYVWKHTHV